MGSAMARFVKQWYARRKAGPVVTDTLPDDDGCFYEFEFAIQSPPFPTSDSQPTSVT